MKVVRDVKYRHIAGYLSVAGRTREGALQAAKRIGTYLLSRLAEEQVRPPRLRSIENSEFVFEIPVILGENPAQVRATLDQLVLAGNVGPLFRLTERSA